MTDRCRRIWETNNIEKKNDSWDPQDPRTRSRSPSTRFRFEERTYLICAWRCRRFFYRVPPEFGTILCVTLVYFVFYKHTHTPVRVPWRLIYVRAARMCVSGLAKRSKEKRPEILFLWPSDVRLTPWGRRDKEKRKSRTTVNTFPTDRCHLYAARQLTEPRQNDNHKRTRYARDCRQRRRHVAQKTKKNERSAAARASCIERRYTTVVESPPAVRRVARRRCWRKRRVYRAS